MTSIQQILINVMIAMFAPVLENFGLTQGDPNMPGEPAADEFFFRWTSTDEQTQEPDLPNQAVIETHYQHTIELSVQLKDNANRTRIMSAMGLIFITFNQRDLLASIKKLIAAEDTVKDTIWGCYIRTMNPGQLEERDDVKKSRSAVISFIFNGGLKI